MATQAQLDEKARQDRLGVENPALEGLATPAQLAEKGQRHGDAHSDFATPAQLAEKGQRDGDAHSDFATPAQLVEKGRRNPPPPLPPRENSASASMSFPAPPPYTSADARRSELISEQWRSHDPRSSSTHSLVPSESGRDGRRTLLLIFIHGFMGNETSFQSFPAHVHNLLTIQLSETHVVHTKIYPRYKSRKAIEFARDDFSNWLEPHEDDNTEVVLLGHSMGGLLAAEVALQRPLSPAAGSPLRHRLLGTINFDTPFLGMHPGVVVSGIGSLFRPAPDPPGSQVQSPGGPENQPLSSQASSSYALSTADSSTPSQLSLIQSITSPTGSASEKDPFFNPPFPNDVRLPERKGWSNLLHFVNKHSDGLTSATKQYFMSHLEFGGCMADYPGLKNRYERIRALEDVDDLAPRQSTGYSPPLQRIRFVNYYTASTGRLKAPKAPKSPVVPPGQILDKHGNLQPIEVEMQDLALEDRNARSPASTPVISVDEHDGGAITPRQLENAPDGPPVEVLDQMLSLGENSGVQNDVQESPPPMQHIDSMPIEDDDWPQPLPEPIADSSGGPVSQVATESSIADDDIPAIKHTPATEPALPPIPPVPTEPEVINLEAYTDKDSRKIAEKEYKRLVKVYNQAVKDRESAIKDRKKLVEKREKQIRQENEKQSKAEQKQRMKEDKEKEKQRLKQQREDEKEEEKRKQTVNPSPPRETQESSADPMSETSKPKRDKKFCMLPPEYGGKRDKTWIRVYMEGVDEVGAHCGLFFPGPQYESLVGDVGERIAQWVDEDATRRSREGVERR